MITYERKRWTGKVIMSIYKARTSRRKRQRNVKQKKSEKFKNKKKQVNFHSHTCKMWNVCQAHFHAMNEQRLKNAQFIFHKSYIPHAVSCSKHIWLHPHWTLHSETVFDRETNKMTNGTRERVATGKKWCEQKKNLKRWNRFFFIESFSSFMELLLCHFTNPDWE